jgi:hypothetical protein
VERHGDISGTTQTYTDTEAVNVVVTVEKAVNVRLADSLRVGTAGERAEMGRAMLMAMNSGEVEQHKRTGR